MPRMKKLSKGKKSLKGLGRSYRKSIKRTKTTASKGPKSVYRRRRRK